LKQLNGNIFITDLFAIINNITIRITIIIICISHSYLYYNWLCLY